MDSVIQRDPALLKILEDRNAFDKATADLSKNGKKGGGIGAGVTKAKGKPTNRISVVAPDGTTGTIEVGEWGMYQSQGFTRVK